MKSAVERTLKAFSANRLTHWAAALTYYGILSIFPALLALISILGLVGESAIQPLIDDLTAVAPGPAEQILANALEDLQSADQAAGIAFVTGLAAAVWSASGYIGAFMDASNAIWGAEGRPVWKKLATRVAITLTMLLLLAITAVLVVVTGPIAEHAGDLIGAGDTAVRVWETAKWPVLLVLVSVMFALLYWAAPNVRQPRLRWVSPGGSLAVVLGLVASAAFAVYVSTVASYSETYGSLGGVIVFLVWLWITNIAILLGATFNAELERGRQIEAGHPSDEKPFLPLRVPPKHN